MRRGICRTGSRAANFLITQYFQFFKGYGPLSTGVHLLPVASSVGIASVVGTKLAVRVGTKRVVAGGLLAMAAFYAWVSTGSATTSYATIALQMVIFGTGMGFTSAPATEAIIGVVPAHKAGVGSAVNDATRLLGGTLGVAVIGSIYASLYADRLTSLLPNATPRPIAHAAHDSVGAAVGAADGLARAGHPGLADGVHDAAASAFFHGFSTANLVAASVAAAGALIALALLPAHPGRTARGAPAPAQPAPATVD
jgi:Major Facilitator Superfamily